MGWKFYAATKGRGHCSRWPKFMSEAERKFLAAQGDLFPVCPGCRKEIDPDWCCCGDARQGHTYGTGHAFVPMGCDCHRVSNH